MITITSDFECGNAKNVTQTGDNRHRLEVVGDKPVYCYYFCFDVRNDGEATTAVIEVWHDPVIDDVPGFISHFPSTIWIQLEGAGRYQPLVFGECETHDDHLVIHLPLAAGQTVRVTDVWPSTYTDTCDFLRGLAEERSDRCKLFTLGQSVQGRDILGVRCGTPGKPRVLGVAGQHPIEFPGIWGMRGIADFMTSLVPDARALREELLVEIIPMVCPDGTVMGRNGFNAEDLDMYQSFGDTPDAPEPEAHESRLLWDKAVADRPDLWMNIHCYLGWRGNSEHPYDGWYEVADPVFSDPKQARLYQAFCDTMRLQTTGPSTHITAATHSPNTTEYQLAKRFGIPHVFYEINGGTAGPYGAGKRALEVF
ncbi:MAG TPA: M14 family zinc carboxypeptidase, partial [Armatimonadota bacterium]|nr:M14 family zinc carboxypeptidase [Armatimonadota bacterium]